MPTKRSPEPLLLDSFHIVLISPMEWRLHIAIFIIQCDESQAICVERAIKTLGEKAAIAA